MRNHNRACFRAWRTERTSRLATMLANPLLGRRVVEAAERGFLPLSGSGLDSVYIQINALVCVFQATVDVEMPFYMGCISVSNEGRKPFIQHIALLLHDNSG